MKTLQIDWKTYHLKPHNSKYLQRFTKKADQVVLRPMVNSIICYTADISKYVHYHLQTIVKHIPFYVKDTKDFINKTNAVKSVPKNSYLVIMDMRSLYTNLPNAEEMSRETTPQRKLQPSKLSQLSLHQYLLWTTLYLIVYITFK